MMIKFKFTKMQGLGNDFVVIDATKNAIRLTKAEVKKIANRKYGIGCDQVLLIEKSKNKNVDFHYRIYNADGAEVAQCGNGARCVAKFIFDKKLSKNKTLQLSTSNQVLVTKYISAQKIQVSMGIPNFIASKIPYRPNKKFSGAQFTALSIGNPHAVIEVKNCGDAKVETLGYKLSTHASFPQQVNVGFMQIAAKNKIMLRVYERGVGETLACGSGACAAVVAGIKLGKLAKQVNVHVLGGKLLISWQGPGQPVWMMGPAKTVFEGQI